MRGSQAEIWNARSLPPVGCPPGNERHGGPSHSRDYGSLVHCEKHESHVPGMTVEWPVQSDPNSPETGRAAGGGAGRASQVSEVVLTHGGTRLL